MKVDIPHSSDNSLKLKNLFPFIVYILIAVLTLPLPIAFPRPELDSSYGIGLNLAFLDHLQFGKDIVFAYGPLGFLNNPLLLDYNLWRLTLLFDIFINFFSVLSIYLLLRTISARWYHYLIVAPFLFSALPFTDPILTILPITIFIYIIISKNSADKSSLIGILFIGLLLSVVSLIKIDIFFASICLIVISVVLFIIKNNNIKSALCLPSSYTLSIIVLWILAGQNLVNIPTYIYSSINVSMGYGQAMAIDGPFWQVQLGLISVLFVVFLLIYSYKSNEKSLMTFLIMNLFTLFTTFKLGFVREDEHVYTYFFKAYLLMFGLILIFMLQRAERNKKNRNQTYSFTILSIIIGSMLILSMHSSAPNDYYVQYNNVFANSSSVKLTAEMTNEMLKSRTVFDDEVLIFKEKIRNNYSLNQGTINYLDSKTVDIFPWDVALCWAHDLNWSPRPMFQSPSAYTEQLDHINSKHFMGAQSPQSILYSFKSIDDKNPLFDEPETFRTILRNYIFKNVSGKFITLERSSNKVENESEINIGTSEAKLGQYVRVPDYKGFVVCYANINYSPLGKIINIIYKTSPIYVQLTLEDGSFEKFRLIPDTARDGLYVSEGAENIDDLSRIFQGKRIESEIIKYIKIDTESPNQYEDLINLDFRGIPANISGGYPGENVARFIHLVEHRKLNNLESTLTNIGSNLAITTGAAVINGERRLVIVQHPLPSEKRYIAINNITIPENAALKFGLALASAVWSTNMGDGVTYEIYIEEDGKTYQKIFSKYIDPKNNLSERKWNDFEVNLSSYKDKKVHFVFNTTGGPKNDCANDWAYWAEPTLIIKDKTA